MEEWRIELKHEIECELITLRAMLKCQPYNKDIEASIQRLEKHIKRYEKKSDTTPSDK